MSEWYFKRKALFACFFLVFSVFCFALAARAGAATPKLTYAQQYAKALCIGVRHSEPKAQEKIVWVQKCTVGPVLGSYPGQMYYVYVVTTYGTVRHYIQVMVDSGANVASEKIIWTHKVSYGPKA